MVGLHGGAADLGARLAASVKIFHVSALADLHQRGQHDRAPREHERDPPARVCRGEAPQREEIGEHADRHEIAVTRHEADVSSAARVAEARGLQRRPRAEREHDEVKRRGLVSTAHAPREHEQRQIMQRRRPGPRERPAEVNAGQGEKILHRVGGEGEGALGGRGGLDGNHEREAERGEQRGGAPTGELARCGPCGDGRDGERGGPHAAEGEQSREAGGLRGPPTALAGRGRERAVGEEKQQERRERELGLKAPGGIFPRVWERAERDEHGGAGECARAIERAQQPRGHQGDAAGVERGVDGHLERRIPLTGEHDAEPGEQARPDGDVLVVRKEKIGGAERTSEPRAEEFEALDFPLVEVRHVAGVQVDLTRAGGEDERGGARGAQPECKRGPGRAHAAGRVSRWRCPSTPSSPTSGDYRDRAAS